MKKKHSSRLVGGVEAGSRAERTRGKAAAGGPGEGAAGGLGGPTFLCGQTRRNNWGVRQTVQPRVTAQEKKTSKHLTIKTYEGEAAAGETPSLTGEFVGETHRGIECAQAHPPGNQHQKGPICLWVEREVTESQQEMNKQHCSLSDPSLTYSTTMQQRGLPCPGEYLRPCPLTT